MSFRSASLKFRCRLVEAVFHRALAVLVSMSDRECGAKHLNSSV